MVLRGLTFALFHVDQNEAPRERAVSRVSLVADRVSLLSFLAA
jgi:hypothetical protein